MTENQRIKDATRQIVKMLIEGDYDELERLTSGCRLSAEEISESLNEYGNTLSMPPENVFNDLDIIKVTGAAPNQWSVWMPLWTIEEGESDLTLELTLIDTGEEMLRAEIDNIH